MTFDEFRIHLLQKLRAAADLGEARIVLTEAHPQLGNGRINAAARKAFWDALYEDIGVLVEEAPRLVACNNHS